MTFSQLARSAISQLRTRNDETTISHRCTDYTRGHCQVRDAVNRIARQTGRKIITMHYGNTIILKLS